MKRILSAVLAVTMASALFTACGTENTTDKRESTQSTTKAAEQAKENVTEKTTEKATEEATISNTGSNTLYLKDDAKSSKAVATFFNSVSGKSEDVEMEKIKEGDESVTFSCEGDCSEYNMAYVTLEKEKTREFAFNKCTSGWHKTEKDLLPYTEGNKVNEFSECDDITLTVGEYDKTIHVWKPDSYDASSDEKYSTVYLLDNEIFSLFAVEQVESMMAVTGQKAIVVAIDTNFARNYEMVPEIGVSKDEEEHGELEYDSMNGSEFSDFVADMLVPHIQNNYNVYTDARHTSIAGASLSGMEAFYITQEHPELFGTLGGFSPSFWEYDDATWKKYLKGRSFGDSSPLLYFYAGGKMDTGSETKDMYNRLKEMGYPESRLILNINEKGTHRATYWCSMFPEFLAAMIFQRAELLQK